MSPGFARIDDIRDSDFVAIRATKRERFLPFVIRPDSTVALRCEVFAAEPDSFGL
jgi:hypothetical protein